MKELLDALEIVNYKELFSAHICRLVGWDQKLFLHLSKCQIIGNDYNGMIMETNDKKKLSYKNMSISAKINILLSNMPYIWYIDAFSFRFFRLPEYAPDYNQNFDITKYFGVYSAKTYFMVVDISGLLQPPFFKL